MPPDAQELYARGVDLANAGRFSDARRMLAAAADAVAAGEEGLDLRARIDGTTAYLLGRSGDVDAGIALCATALEREGLGGATRAILAGQMGALELERGALDRAVSWLTRAIDGMGSDDIRTANMRMNRSLANMQSGRLEAARADLVSAEAAFRAAGDMLAADQAVHNRGYVSMLAGDLVEALATMQSVREPLDDGSDFWAAVNELDRAEVLRDAGLVTEAERSLAGVARVFGREHAPGDRARAEYQLARSLLDHDPARAATVAAASARRFRGLGSESWAARADAVRLRARLSRGRLDRSGRPLATGRAPTRAAVDEVVSSLRLHGFPHDAAALRLTATLAALRAGREPAGADPRLSKGSPIEVALLAHEVAVERARRAGREADARRRAARGIDLLESSVQVGGSLEQQGSIVRQGLGLMAAGLASAVRSGRPDVVFEWSERSRHLTAQVVPLRPPPDPVLAADLAELRRLRVADPDGEWLADPRAEVLRSRARERQWSGTQAAGLHDRVGLESLQGELGAGTALVSYVFDGMSLVALRVTRAQAELVRLDWPRVRAALDGLRADLDVSAAVRAGPMVGVVRAALRGRLEALSRELVAPILDGAEDPERVVITAPGVLAGIPWAMLPALRGTPVSVAASASRWVASRAAPYARPARAALAAGPRVARGEEEIALGSAAWNSPTVLRAQDATVSAVTAAASGSDVLHIAAHGKHAADHPLFSGLELADGTLFGYDIDLVPEVPPTVVLSACEVGRSTVRWGEEAVGMTRVWLHAGARCVIAAPVIVADDVACELLGAMHTKLAAGLPPADALAAAASDTGIVAPFQAHGAGF